MLPSLYPTPVQWRLRSLDGELRPLPCVERKLGTAGGESGENPATKHGRALGARTALDCTGSDSQGESKMSDPARVFRVLGTTGVD